MADSDLHHRADVFTVVDADQVTDVEWAEGDDHEAADQVSYGFLSSETDDHRDDSAAGQQWAQYGLGWNEQREDAVDRDS